MRQVLRKILQILDGSPRPHSDRRRGQSLVEMAFITPLLAIMVVGIAEVGWYANNYLIILEVSRVGARTGTQLGGEQSPLMWVEQGSIHPQIYDYALNDFVNPPMNWTLSDIRGDGTIPIETQQARDCTRTGFYTFIACSMIDSMAPLIIKPASSNPYDIDKPEKPIIDRSGAVARTIPYPDDIIISVFSLQKIYNGDPAAQAGTDHYTVTIDMGDAYPPGHQVIVVGRYPTTANECNWHLQGTVDRAALVEDPVATAQLNSHTVVSDVSSDPFDYIVNGTRDTAVIGGRANEPIELAGWDDVPEIQRGFTWTGQHFIEEDIYDEDDDALYPVLCWGSEWSSSEIEELMNVSGFFEMDPMPLRQDYASDVQFEADMTAWRNARINDADLQEQLSFLTSQGLVLVEFHWMHSTLLNFPFIDPMMRIFGDSQNIKISSWAAFPVPIVEPGFVYQLP